LSDLIFHPSPQVPNQYLQYWKPSTAEVELQADSLFTHSGSGQIRDLAPDDVLWTVTAWPGGWLTLLGRLIVGQVVDQDRARALLGTNNVWDAPFHAIAKPGSAEPLREIDLSDIAAELRFESKHDRLRVSAGRVDAAQLQSMRQLTPGAADLLESRWFEEAEIVAPIEEVVQRTQSLGAFGSPETNRRVEIAARDFVLAQFTTEAWSVMSVEHLKIGYDLRCIKGEKELHIEVKGTQASELVFIITANEVRRAETDASFVLCVVTNALRPEIQMHRIEREQLFADFDLQPLAYRAALSVPE
jgi:hypothetical protein